ncbi:alpha/beta hydrolase [Nocardioides speluncae]|uniref:alpha/beta hydrolase n=1 Tax=Nocardioides speluncae TaxID=2670337 RepID=UPI000D69D385|nr:alpha/beta hydrolase [Nocardioides speluncae]
MPTLPDLSGATVRAKRSALLALLALPAPALRRLVGPAVVIDGDPVDLETQLTLWLGEKTGDDQLAESIDAGRRQLVESARIVGGRQPIGATRDLDAGGVPARFYEPRAAAPVGPLLVYFHGGGFIQGDLESHDALCRFLAERARTRVLSVDYRLAPEAPFPAAPDDCAAAYRWAVEHAAELGADPDRLAVGGDSAGGNLAANVAIVAAREGLPLRFQLLLYPVTNAYAETASRKLFGEGFFLTSEFMDYALETYIPNKADYDDPRVTLLNAELPAGLAPAWVATAGFDPLRDEGEEYAERMRAAGAQVVTRRFGGQIHGFASIVGAGRSGPAAAAEVAATLRAGLA